VVLAETQAPAPGTTAQGELQATSAQVEVETAVKPEPVTP
jgi:hypothetical protein